MRRTWLCGLIDVTKRYLIATAARNLGQVLRTLFGIGKPRTLQGSGERGKSGEGTAAAGLLGVLTPLRDERQPDRFHDGVRNPACPVAECEAEHGRQVPRWQQCHRAYCGTWWLRGKRIIDQAQLVRLNETVFYPIEVYAMDEWPGGRMLRIVAHWCMFNGNRTPMTWDEIDRLL